LDTDRTSFGENHHQDEGRKVEERMPKVFLRKNIGTAFAGNVGLAVEIIGTFHNGIDKDATPKAELWYLPVVVF